MLTPLTKMEGFTIQATDGASGELKECFFDDNKWMIRHLVAQLGGWFISRKVLIPPPAINRILWDQSKIEISISRKEVEESPDVDSDMPVSRQMEIMYNNYVRWPFYGSGSEYWGMTIYPELLVKQRMKREPPENEKEKKTYGDPHLRSTNEVFGYQVEASDYIFGQVKDFLVEDRTWMIRYLVIKTNQYFSQHHILVPTECVRSVSFSSESFLMNLPKQVMERGPAYDPKLSVDIDFEDRLYRYYGLSGYWKGKMPFKPDQEKHLNISA